jgi:hypothetical protein
MDLALAFVLVVAALVAYDVGRLGPKSKVHGPKSEVTTTSEISRDALDPP